MATDLTHEPAPQTVDLTGLPEPVVQDIRRLVQTLRDKLNPQPTGQPQSIIGLFADQGITTPSLEAFDEARRELWANFPREFPDPAK
jgi:hypothetical protein